MLLNSARNRALASIFRTNNMITRVINSPPKMAGTTIATSGMVQSVPNQPESQLVQ